MTDGLTGGPSGTVNLPNPITVDGKNMALLLNLNVDTYPEACPTPTEYVLAPPVQAAFELTPMTIAAQPANSANGLALGLEGIISFVGSGASRDHGKRIGGQPDAACMASQPNRQHGSPGNLGGNATDSGNAGRHGRGDSTGWLADGNAGFGDQYRHDNADRCQRSTDDGIQRDTGHFSDRDRAARLFACNDQRIFWLT